jgi:hypothetical protein
LLRCGGVAQAAVAALLDPAVEPNWVGKVLRTLSMLGADHLALQLLRAGRRPAPEDGVPDLAIPLDVWLRTGCVMDAFLWQVRGRSPCGTHRGREARRARPWLT